MSSYEQMSGGMEATNAEEMINRLKFYVFVLLILLIIMTWTTLRLWLRELPEYLGGWEDWYSSILDTVRASYMRSQINLVLEEAEQRLKHRLEDQAKQLNEGHMMEMTKLKKLHKSETQEKNYMSLKIQMQLRNDHQDERDDMLDRIADLNRRQRVDWCPKCKMPAQKPDNKTTRGGELSCESTQKQHGAAPVVQPEARKQEPARCGDCEESKAKIAKLQQQQKAEVEAKIAKLQQQQQAEVNAKTAELQQQQKAAVEAKTAELQQQQKAAVEVAKADASERVNTASEAYLRQLQLQYQMEISSIKREMVAKRDRYVKVALRKEKRLCAIRRQLEGRAPRRQADGMAGNTFQNPPPAPNPPIISHPPPNPTTSNSGWAQTYSTGGPSTIPTGGPSTIPTPGPSTIPIAGPSKMPTGGSSMLPTAGPSKVSTGGPSTIPTWGASKISIGGPSTISTGGPSTIPTGAPGALVHGRWGPADIQRTAIQAQAPPPVELKWDNFRVAFKDHEEWFNLTGKDKYGWDNYLTKVRGWIEANKITTIGDYEKLIEDCRDIKAYLASLDGKPRQQKDLLGNTSLFKFAKRTLGTFYLGHKTGANGQDPPDESLVENPQELRQWRMDMAAYAQKHHIDDCMDPGTAW